MGVLTSAPHEGRASETQLANPQRRDLYAAHPLRGVSLDARATWLMLERQCRTFGWPEARPRPHLCVAPVNLHRGPGEIAAMTAA